MLRHDRQTIIDEIINLGVNEVGAPASVMAGVILAVTPEILCWEITGTNVITPKLLEIEATPGHPLAPLLSSIINAKGETMIQAITRMVGTSPDEI